MVMSSEIAALDRLFDAGLDRYTSALEVARGLQQVRDNLLVPTGDTVGAVRRYNAILDHLLRRTCGFVAKYVGAPDDPARLPLAMVATGAYGRKQINGPLPLDLVVIHRGEELAPPARGVVEALPVFLGASGHTVRIEVAPRDRFDITSAATLRDEGRMVLGDSHLVREIVDSFFTLRDRGERSRPRGVTLVQGVADSPMGGTPAGYRVIRGRQT